MDQSAVRILAVSSSPKRKGHTAPQGGETEVLENLAMTFNQMGVLLPPYSLIFYRGIREDNWAFVDAKLLAKRMIQKIRAQKALNLKWH